jgi:hypothetical protein
VSAAAPFLSVVVTTRNDDHGGDPLVRTQAFVNNLILQCGRHRLHAELVIVEWNPPADRPPLAEALAWPDSDGFCAVRIVQVPNGLHRRLEHSARLPLFQMIGKNVGIRRARGEYVLATNIDLVFSDELMEVLAAGRLDPSLLYRVDRWDVEEGLDPFAPVDEQLRFCERSLIRVNRREGTLDLLTGEFYRIYHDVPLIARLPFVSAAISIRFRMARYVLWRLYAFAYWIVAGLWPPQAVPRRVRKRLGPLLGPMGTAPSPIAIVAAPVVAIRRLGLLREVLRGNYLRFRKKLDMFWEGWAFEQSRIRLHTNASGDFTLMSKDAWLTTRGYAELEMYSMHIDGLLLYQAHYAGIRESFLPHRVYHMEHEGGFKPDSEGTQRLNARLARDAIPQISNEQLMQWIYEMYVTKRPLDLNRDDWGFSDEQLAETVVYPRGATGEGHLSGASTAAAIEHHRDEMGDG